MANLKALVINTTTGKTKNIDDADYLKTGVGLTSSTGDLYLTPATDNVIIPDNKFLKIGDVTSTILLADGSITCNAVFSIKTTDGDPSGVFSSTNISFGSGRGADGGINPSGNGGSTTIASGAGGDTDGVVFGGAGGAIGIYGGAGGAGLGSITAGNGGAINIFAGGGGSGSTNSGSGNGGTLSIGAGFSSGNSNGSHAYVRGGASGPSGANGGTVFLIAGNGTTGLGGDIELTAGTGGTTNGIIHIGESQTSQVKIGASLLTTANVAIGQNTSTTLSIVSTLSTGITPTSDNAVSLGTTAKRLANIHSGSLTVHTDNTDTAKITLSGTSIVGAGADLTISTANATISQANNYIYITAGAGLDSTTAPGHGSEMYLTSGAGGAALGLFAAASAGGISLTGGVGGAGSATAAAGLGGGVGLRGGDGGSNGGGGGGLGGGASLAGGQSTGDNMAGGAVIIQGGDNFFGNDSLGGDIQLIAGGGITGGNVYLRSGSSGPTSISGNVIIETHPGDGAFGSIHIGVQSITGYTDKVIIAGISLILNSTAATVTTTGLISLVSLLSGEAIAIGAPVGIESSSSINKAFRCVTNSGGNRHFVVGLATTVASASDTTFNIQTTGEITVPDAAWSSVPAAANMGAMVYAVSTGKLSLTAPVGSGHYVQKIGLLSYADGTADTTRIILHIVNTTVAL